MLKNSFYTLLFLCLSGVLFGQKESLKVYLRENQMYDSEAGNYIEIQLTFFGHTVSYVEKGDSLQGEIEVTQIFSQEDSVVLADKYLLQSPTVRDSIFEDFYDFQRYALPAGNYKYELKIRDINASGDDLSVQKHIEIENRALPAFSAFIPAASIRPNPNGNTLFSRAGYDVEPLLGSYYPEELTNLLYYVELYNLDQLQEDSVFVVEQKLIGRGNSYDLSSYTRYFRYKASPLQPVSKVIDISELPTGAYRIELNLINRNKEVIASVDYDFDRNNREEINALAYQNVIVDPAFKESVTEDSLAYYVGSLIPISRPAEVKNILKLLKQKDKEKNFQYLQAFWLEMDGKNAYESWIKYKAQVQLVEKLYATNYQVGFETDRGRVYLAYGAPSSIIEEPSSPSEYPYEIWQYDRIRQYSNRRFIFYSPTNLNKEYELLHSDMIGEVNNHRWKYLLNKRNTPDADITDPTGGSTDHFGGNSSRYFNTY